MFSNVFKTVVATILVSTVVVVAETRKLNEDERELLQLREENSKLNQELLELRQNHSLLAKHETGHSEAGPVRKELEVERTGISPDVMQCVQNTMRLLEEGIETYDSFMKEQLSEADCMLCKPECYGYGDATCPGCSDYRQPSCQVSEYVQWSLLVPFSDRADDFRKKAENMLQVVQQSIRAQFRVST